MIYEYAKSLMRISCLLGLNFRDAQYLDDETISDGNNYLTSSIKYNHDNHCIINSIR